MGKYCDSHAYLGTHENHNFFLLGKYMENLEEKLWQKALWEVF